jgi:hypothetical protein
MAGYTKLFNSILASTVWREPNEVRILWITMLAMADRTGLVEGSVPGLADFARISVDSCRDALARLSSPDPDSRTKSAEGRRIQEVDGGWLVINHNKYRAKMGADERREYNRVKQAEYRKRRSVTALSIKSMTVNHNDGCVDKAEAEADTEIRGSTVDPDQSNMGDPRAHGSARLLNGNPHHKATNLINGAEIRRHGAQHAWCSWPERDGLCVSHALHGEFVGKSAKTDADVKTWYAATLEKFKGVPIGEDPFHFWRNEFVQWVGTATSRPADTQETRTIAAARRTRAALLRGEL